MVGRRNFTKLGRGIGQSFLHKKFVSAFGYLAAFLNWAVQISVMLNTTLNFALSDLPVKIR